MYLDLFANVTIVASFLFLFGQIFKNHSLSIRQPIKIQIISGVFFGILGDILMLYTIHATTTVIADLRIIPVISAGIFGGPLSSLIASVFIAIFRMAKYGVNTASVVAAISALFIGTGCACIISTKFSILKKYIIMTFFSMIITGAAFSYSIRDISKLLKIFSYYYPIFIFGVVIAYFVIQYIISSNLNYKAMTYFRIMANNHSDMISAHNPDGTYLYASPSSSQLLGYSPDDLIGLNPLDAVHPDDLDSINIFTSNLNISDSNTYFYRLKRRQGEYIWVEMSAKTIRNKDNRVIEIVCVTRDISKRKFEEEKLQKINEELKEQKINAELQRAAAIEATQLKSQFLANMSHELRTPLNSIIGFTTRVIKKCGDSLPPIQKDNLIIVKEEAHHLLDLINSLLDYSKIEAGKMEIHTEAFNLFKVIEEVYAMTKTLSEGKKVRYKQELFTTDLIPMTSDRIKVKQILINLLSNALKYSDKGTVLLSVNKEEDFYCISVEDEGIGISAENTENIFDEFRQVDGSYTRKVGGTGLGLSITKKFVEMLGGKIQVTSTLGVGSCFTVYLPIEFIDKKDKNEISESKAIAKYRKKVVCIDDDFNVQKLYKQYLNEHEFEAIALDGHEDVVNKIMEMTPDVILLDIMLPYKDGWEILTELKNNNKTRKIPVIMASVLSEKNLAYRMKADDYLIKPITQEELFETIIRVISKKSGIDVLVADDDENFLNLMGQFLEEESISYRFARDGEETLQQMLVKKPDILILDIMMPKKDGFTVIEDIRKTEVLKDTPIIVVTSKDLSNQEKAELYSRTSMVIQKSGTLIENVMQVLLKKIKEKTNDAENFTC